MERLERELDLMDEPIWSPPNETEAIKQFNNLSRASETFSMGQTSEGMSKDMRDDVKWAEEMASKLRGGRA